MIFCRIHSTSFPPEPISGKIVHYTVLLKGNVALARILFSSELGYSSEQRVEEMASQANTRLEPLAQLSFLHTVVPSRCCESRCEYSSENSILYHAMNAGKVSSK